MLHITAAPTVRASTIVPSTPTSTPIQKRAFMAQTVAAANFSQDWAHLRQTCAHCCIT